MTNSEIATAFKILYTELVNEIDNHNAGRIDASTEVLADAVKAAIRNAHNCYCEPDDQI